VLPDNARFFTTNAVKSFGRGCEMRNKRRDPKWWIIIALLNILVIEYPAGLYLQAGDDSSRVTAALMLGGVGLVLAIADCFTVLLAVAQ
jgi:hypothetical protein